jgi:TonB family protein
MTERERESLADESQREAEQTALRKVRGLLDDVKEHEEKQRKLRRRVLIATPIAVVLLVFLGPYFYSAARRSQGAPKTPALMPPKKFANLEEYVEAVKRGVKAEFLGYSVRAAEAVVDLSLSKSGTIVGLKIAKSSGMPREDEAVLEAIRRAEPFPTLVASGAQPTQLRLTFSMEGMSLRIGVERIAAEAQQ